MRFGGRAFIAAALAATSVALCAHEQDQAAAQRSDVAATGARGLWVPDADLQRLPTQGVAWDSVKRAADGPLGKPEISNLNSKHDVLTLAVALVFARTKDERYRGKAADAILAAMRSGKNAKYGSLARARNVVSYVIAADLIDLRAYAPQDDVRFRDWLRALPSMKFKDGTMAANHEHDGNNHGTMAGAGRAAIAAYLGDTATLARVAAVLRGWLGERSSYVGFKFKKGLTWQADPANPVGINPRGATKDGHSIDGALPEEMRRGCAFTWAPCYTHYPWEGLAGALMQASLLARQGYEPWGWGDQALLRAVRWLYDLRAMDPRFWDDARDDDGWVVDVVNSWYRSTFPTVTVKPPSKIIGWTSWTHPAPDALPAPPPPAPEAPPGGPTPPASPAPPADSNSLPTPQA